MGPARWEKLLGMSCFMEVAGDEQIDEDWLSVRLPSGGTTAWMKGFQTAHFVHVHAEAGLDGTPCAEDHAIRLLAADCDSALASFTIASDGKSWLMFWMYSVLIK